MTDGQVWIRPYRPEDRQDALSLAGRLEIGVAAWRDPDAVREAVLGWVRDSLDRSTAENREVLVAVDADRLVGLVTLGQRQHFAGETDAYVGELVVAAGMERRGVGTLLMRAAEEWGRRRGLKFLTLETGAANSTARAFYASLGYQEEDVRLTRELGRGETAEA
jgi:GNAT superfamily N-acetyltransferase